ncbi:MAG: ABC transporter ATP-binding protein [Deltaproteobacteria bacterium]
MKRLFKYLKPYWKAVALAPLFMLLEVITDLLQPALMADIVDKGIKSGNISYIINVGLVMIGVALLGILGGVGCTIFASKAALNFSADLRMDLFKKIQSFSFDSLDKFSTASLITRLTNDVVQIQNFILAMLRIMVRSPLLCIGGIIMALLINAHLALILLVTIPILSVALAYIIKKGFSLFSSVQKKLDKVNDVVRENLTGIRVVKSFVRADYENNRFNMANTNLKEVTVKASRIIGLTMPLMILVMNISIIAVIWFGGIKVNAGSMKVGQVMAFINYMTQILFSLMMIAFILMMVSRAKASADRLADIINSDTDIKDLPEASIEPIKEGRIVFDDVSFRYANAVGEPVLKNITFSAMPGETVAILGSTGSGKSTLVNLIPRFYDAISGKILIDDKNIKDIKLKTLRSNISMVLQESILFSGTVMDNLRWGKEDAAEEEVFEAARVAQAHDFIINLPEGYNSILGQRGVNVSGGQKQRLAIARALLKKPVILILDDSTSSVDMGTEAKIQKALKNFMKNTTCFVIAQRISTVLEADKIIVLENGEIVDMGTHKELLERCSVYQDIYNSQIGEEGNL